MVALHARRSRAIRFSVRRSRTKGGLLLALTGTDVYREIHNDAAKRSQLAGTALSCCSRALMSFDPGQPDQASVIVPVCAAV